MSFTPETKIKFLGIPDSFEFEGNPRYPETSTQWHQFLDVTYMKKGQQLTVREILAIHDLNIDDVATGYCDFTMLAQDRVVEIIS